MWCFKIYIYIIKDDLNFLERKTVKGDSPVKKIWSDIVDLLSTTCLISSRNLGDINFQL